MPESAAELETLYARAAEATATNSKSFYFATKFFPPDLARSAHAVYWFCRTTDDLVDEAPNPEEGRDALNAWAADFGSPEPRSPVLRLFRSVQRQHSIPAQYPLDLIEGVRMDLSISHYKTFEELRIFCYRVASTVGLMMMHVIGFEGAPHQQAIDLGIALQLTNILRDIGEDLGRGRIYIPEEELDRFGLKPEDLQAHCRDERFRRLMRFQDERARDYYRRGLAGLSALHPDGRFAVEIAARVYAGILERIERSGYDVYERRAVVPAAAKYWITMRCLAPVIMRSAGRIAFWR